MLELHSNVPIGMMASMRGTRTPMSEKDVRRPQIMELVVEETGTLKDAAQIMEVSCRHGSPGCEQTIRTSD
ncbi:MAG: hypothetical protein EA383_00825 [Spirochaetaceae bacterium]|nr:MAG: hypothetical protein EA383_00825 [Spirochaetaceae bacterium]